jgi:GH15 family glucan-1,4-alpha-glucosidase
LVNLWDKSIAVIEANQAENGAFIASPNFPTYHFSWFRDGAYIAYALNLAGRSERARRFFDWATWAVEQRKEQAERAIMIGKTGISPDPADLLETRYSVDGKSGEEEWFNNQLDGFGTLLWAIGQHRTQTGEAPAAWRPAVQLLARYLSALWRFPCADCWEEFNDKIHVASLAAIYGGLVAAAEWLGEPGFANEAAVVRAFAREHGIVNGSLVKFVGTDWVDASLIHAASPFRLLEVDDPVMVRTVERMEAELRIDGGGLHRYVQDNYFGGGEWILLTAYFGWFYLERGEREKAEAIRAWIEAHETGDGELPEQVQDTLLIPEMMQPWIERWGPPATPLLWSHAAYVTFVHAFQS